VAGAACVSEGTTELDSQEQEERTVFSLTLLAVGGFWRQVLGCGLVAAGVVLAMIGVWCAVIWMQPRDLTKSQWEGPNQFEE
jgi:hypothetical protein